MLTMVLWVLLRAAPEDAVGRCRVRVLRPCSTVVADFVDHRVLAHRAGLVFTVVFAVVMSGLLLGLVLLGLHPLLAVEVVVAIGMLAVHVAAKLAPPPATPAVG